MILIGHLEKDFDTLSGVVLAFVGGHSSADAWMMKMAS